MGLAGPGTSISINLILLTLHPCLPILDSSLPCSSSVPGEMLAGLSYRTRGALFLAVPRCPTAYTTEARHGSDLALATACLMLEWV